jgi:hypothetical protein
VTTSKTEREEGLEFALQLMGASSEQLAKTTNTLLDNYKYQAETAEATLKAIREQIEVLFMHPWQPSQHAIEKALWPSEEFIDRMRPAKEY